MSEPKKFGTFGGVYTPSILTILGVIMYMRLGWVVGSAGSLFTIFIIILMAHLVSITTGLSVSSVATDKKIKAGGIYYMLSRSLGLPIGGSIGITLFVATGLSIALYLIGFAESAVAIFQEPLGIETITLNHLRIVGSIALFIIVTIAFISTSIAIKSQYFILAAIVLSLVSVFFGTTDGKEFDITSEPSAEVGFAVLFGIFFPAVTGFTAGVAMSGDLKDPKKSIPWGTMLSIFTGLVVYLILAVFIYFSIDKEILVGDKGALVTFGLVPGLVIAGIWGATLSSALGGILGGPRILQAMSIDKITPKLFAKGVGADNEPRNALILTYVLAQCGILIGELDVIAEVVAMFYMTAYLFINISCLLEQWASPDFLPKLKISFVVPLLGAIITFLLMIQLNLVAAVASIVIMILLFLLLTRKQLDLGSGDVWKNVWYGVVKLGLNNLLTQKGHKRNWEPNMLTFYKENSYQSESINFAKSLSGKLGFITQFTFTGNLETVKKHEQVIHTDENKTSGFYSRVINGEDYYSDIIHTAKHFGFSGIEPNTVSLSIDKENRADFIQAHNQLSGLDYNLVYLSLDENKLLGNKKKIDIWWNDFTGLAEFTLSLSRFFSQSLDWKNAEIRILFYKSEAITLAIDDIKHVINKLITEFRLDIPFQIVSGASYYDMVKEYSFEADVTVLKADFDTVESYDEQLDFIDSQGTCLLLKQSSYFDKIDIEKYLIDTKKVSKLKRKRIKQSNTSVNIDENFSLYPVLKNIEFDIRKQHQLLSSSFASVEQEYVNILKEFKNLTSEFKSVINKNNDSLIQQEVTYQSYLSYLRDVQVVFSDKLDNLPERAYELLIKSIDTNLTSANYFINSLPKSMRRRVDKVDLRILNSDTFLDKTKKRLLVMTSMFKKGYGSIKVPVKSYVELEYYTNYLNHFNAFDSIAIKKEIHQLFDGFHQIFKMMDEHLTHAPNQIIERLEDKIDSTIKKVSFKNRVGQILDVSTHKFILHLESGFKNLRLANYLEESLEKKKQSKYVNLVKATKNYANDVKVYLNYKHDGLILLTVQSIIKPQTQILITKLVKRLDNQILLKKEQEIKQIAETLSKDNLLQEDAKNQVLDVFANLEPIDISLNRYLTFSSKAILNTVGILEKELFILSNQREELFLKTSTFSLKPTKVAVDSLFKNEFNYFFIQEVEEISRKTERYINNLIYDFKTKARIIEVANFNNVEDINLAVSQLHPFYTSFIDSYQLKTNAYKREISQIDNDFWESFHAKINPDISTVRKSKKTNVVYTPIYKIKEKSKKLYQNSISFIEKQNRNIQSKKRNERVLSLSNDKAKINLFTNSLYNTANVDFPQGYEKLINEHYYSSNLINYQKQGIKLFKQAIQKNGVVFVVGGYLEGKHSFINNSIKDLKNSKELEIDISVSAKGIKSDFNQWLLIELEGKSVSNYIKTNSINKVIIHNVHHFMIDEGLMKLLENLVVETKNKLTVVLACSTLAFERYSKVYELFNMIDYTITLEPLSKTLFHDEFLNRVLATGKLHEVNTKLLTNKSSKKILSNLYKTTQGNLGIASQLWLKNISEVNNNVLKVSMAKDVYFPDIEEKDWLIIIKSFLIFEKLTTNDLKAYFNNAIDVEYLLFEFVNMGLINEIEKDVYTIEPVVYPFLLNALKNKRILN